ncbi:hypothetical protein ESA94_02770 [Lacibacter luteus]|uniref:Cardiolipin synthase N-terminal domain-containing protein n=1 Tax=Lacibacter luteus TaxID=2508719 RepID=A0A4Q1CLR5_9BACT|nr:PLDc N-terminal domain-containing protein [Lacibacter luteus]RXK61953.1 hypothetical protein ESA94_02770 [Lacibacter luteus]
MTLLSPDWTLIFWALFSLLFLAVFIRAVYSVWGRNDLYQSTKLLWSIFIVLAPVIGLVCYFMFGSRSDISLEEENN